MLSPLIDTLGDMARESRNVRLWLFLARRQQTWRPGPNVLGIIDTASAMNGRQLIEDFRNRPEHLTY